ncbi:MAG: hypothetical protein HKN47_06725 [Pirellulaceae bacterium]|nr:hypothetical protein [Pirellulaceae bacterium]
MNSPFRFAAILQLRQHERDEIRLSLARLFVKLDAIEQQCLDLQTQQAALKQDPNLRQVGRVPLEALKTIARHDRNLQQQLDTLFLRRAEIQQQVAENQMLLQQAQIEVKRFEKLAVADSVGHQAHQKKIQQRESDDRACRATRG